VKADVTTHLERLMSRVGLVVVGASGIALGVVKYLLVPLPDDLGVAIHPWQPGLLHAHVLTAPMLVLAVGMVIRSHAVSRLEAGTAPRSRGSGVVLWLAGLPMIGSGAFVQVAGSESARLAAVVVHVASSAVFVVASLVHVVRALAVRGQWNPSPPSSQEGATE